MVCCFFMALSGRRGRRQQNKEKKGKPRTTRTRTPTSNPDLGTWGLSTGCPCLSPAHSSSPIACLLASFLMSRVPLCPILYHTAGRCPFARMWPWPWVLVGSYAVWILGRGLSMGLGVWAMSLQCLRWPGESYLWTDATKWSCLPFPGSGDSTPSVFVKRGRGGGQTDWLNAPRPANGWKLLLL